MKILNLNEIKDARVTDMIKFNCEMCGKNVLLQKRYFTKPLCKKCKIKDTVINRYGVTNVFNIKKSRANLKKSLNNKETIEKRKNTCLQKYGTEFQIASPITRKKIKNTFIEKYGVEYNFQIEDIKNKISKTKKEKYGLDNPNIKWLYKYKNEKFDSSWELAYWIWNEDHNIPIKRNDIGFELENGRKYFPDFNVNGQLVEIKSSYLISQPSYKFKEKINIEKNIIVILDKEIRFYLSYIQDLYGKNYLKLFKIKMSKIKAE